jgi:hypothetical protein
MSIGVRHNDRSQHVSIHQRKARASIPRAETRGLPTHTFSAPPSCRALLYTFGEPRIRSSRAHRRSFCCELGTSWKKSERTSRWCGPSSAWSRMRRASSGWNLCHARLRHRECTCDCPPHPRSLTASWSLAGATSTASKCCPSQCWSATKFAWLAGLGVLKHWIFPATIGRYSSSLTCIGLTGETKQDHPTCFFGVSLEPRFRRISLCEEDVCIQRPTSKGQRLRRCPVIGDPSHQHRSAPNLICLDEPSLAHQTQNTVFRIVF